MGKKSKNKIESKIWKFMNESPILSGIIISILAILGSLFVKIYTYIYWLPYFEFFNIPMQYFDIVIFDKYTIVCKIIFISLLMIMILSIIEYMEKRYRFKRKLGSPKLILAEIIILFGNLILQSMLLETTTLPNLVKKNILQCVEWIMILLIVKSVCSLLLSKIKLRKMFFSIVFGAIFVLIGTGGLVYIHGYNENVVEYLSGMLRIIDDDKIVLFETSDQYYVVPYKKEKAATIYMDIDSYEFIDKNKQLIERRYYVVYDESGKKLN